MQQVYTLVIALTVFWLIDKYLGKKEKRKRIKNRSYPKFYFSAKTGWYQLKNSYQQQSKVFYVSPTNYFQSHNYYTTIS